jgi:hypothetical protein
VHLVSWNAERPGRTLGAFSLRVRPRLSGPRCTGMSRA